MNDMNDSEQDLAGRVDAVAQALVWLTAELEVSEAINGPRLSAAWRARRLPDGTPDEMAQACLRTLVQMADALDAARSVRQSRGRQRGSRSSRTPV